MFILPPKKSSCLLQLLTTKISFVCVCIFKVLLILVNSVHHILVFVSLLQPVMCVSRACTVVPCILTCFHHFCQLTRILYNNYYYYGLVGFIKWKGEVCTVVKCSSQVSLDICMCLLSQYEKQSIPHTSYCGQFL